MKGKETPEQKEARKRKELVEMLTTQEEVHCLDQASYITLLALAVDLGIRGTIVKAKIIKGFKTDGK